MTTRHHSRPSARQIDYAMALLRRRGYSTGYMRAEHKAIGASQRERRGTVSDWLAGMDRARISTLISELSR